MLVAAAVVDNDGTKTLQVTQLRRIWCFLPDLDVLVAVNKGMPAVKLCCNKILQFVTGDAG